jgi:hypothetical protein
MKDDVIIYFINMNMRDCIRLGFTVNNLGKHWYKDVTERFVRKLTAVQFTCLHIRVQNL